MSITSADPDDLDGFVSRASRARRSLEDRQRDLVSQEAAVVGMCGEFGVSSGVLASAGTVLAGFEANERFVDTVSDTLRKADRDPSTGSASIDSALVAAALRSAGLTQRPPRVDVEPAQLLGIPPTSGFVDDPICAANGNFVQVETDLAFPGWAAILDVVRVYNSLAATRIGAFGPGWSSTLDMAIHHVEGGVLRVELADGAVIPFAETDGVLRSPGPRRLRAERTGSGWSVHDGQLRSFHFDGDGALVGAESPPVSLRVVREDGRIAALVEERSGRSVAFEWEDARVVAAHTGDGRSVFYRYDDEGALVSVDRPTGSVTYSVTAGLVTAIVDADGVVVVTNVYDEEARVASQTSDLGRTTIYSYSEAGTTLVSDTIDGPRNAFTHDRRGNVTAVVDGAGRVMRITYDDAGHATAVTDRTGALRRFAFDDRGNLVARSDPDGLGAAWEWDDLDRLVAETHRNGAVTTYAYEGSRRLPVRIVGPQDEAFSIILCDDADLPAAVVDPDGVVNRFEWDGDGQMSARIDGLGHRTTFAFDDAGLLREVVDPTGLTTELVSDSAGRVVEAIVAGAASRHSYSPAGRPVSGSDAAGVSWSATYASSGKADSFSDGAGSTVGLEWDPFGNLAAVVAPDGARFEQRHDAMGRLVATRDPEGNELVRDYDPEGRMIALTDAAGRSWRRRLDVMGRTRTSTAPDGAVTHYRYHPDGTIAEVRHPDASTVVSEVDPNGRIVAVVEPLGGRFEFEYTPAGRLRRRTSPAGRVETFEYDAAGRLVAHRRGPVETRLDLDARGRLVRATGPDGAADYRYAAGELVGVEGPDASVMVERDPAGRITSVSDGEGGRSTYAWDERGLVSEATDASGITTTFGRDVRGRLATTSCTGAGHTTYGYDAIGYLRSVTDATGTLSRTLDPTGVPVAQGDADGTMWERDLDAAGRTISVRAEGATAAEYRYDVMGQLVEAVRSAGSLRTSLGWDAAGRLVSTEGPAGSLAVERDGDGAVSGWSLDGRTVRAERGPDDRIVALHDPVAGRVERPGRPRSRRDRAGRITGSDDGSLYRYDTAGRLVEAVTPDGRRWAFSYGSDGLLESEDGPDGERRYTRGFLGRLEGIEFGDGRQTRFDHDGAGRRVAAHHSDGSSRHWLWDRLGQLVAVEDRSGATVIRRLEVDVDALGRPVSVGGAGVAWDDARTGLPLRIGATSYLHLDDRARAATSTATWIDAPADPWGAEDPAGATAGPHLGYRNELAAWGLVWLGVRVYDPATREFLSPDPLPAVAGRPGAAGVYAYGFLDPVNHLDPSGMRPISQKDFDKIREREEQGRLGQAWQAITEDPWGTLALVGVVAGGAGLVVFAGPVLAAAGAGILIGAGASAAIGVLSGGFSPRSTAVSGAIGAVPGGNSFRSAMAVGAATGAGQELGTQVVQGDGINWTNVAAQGVFGAGTGALTRGVQVRMGGADPPIPQRARFVVDSEGVVTDLRPPVPRMADDFVDLASPARRTHILQGDATGGGHIWPGQAGKTPFPQSWSGDRIMHEISDIATDPVAWRNPIPQGSRTVLTGTRGGVDVRVVVDTRTGEIISGFPTNLTRNP